ncbi:MAG: STAS domain-containing protein [Terrimicrobiaceae bacterium]
MNIQRSDENGVTILALEGRLDTSTTTIYDQIYTDAFAGGARKFVLDCAKLSYISSAGLRSFLHSLKQLGASGGKLALATPSHMVLEVLEISGFKPLITICPNRAAAVAALA